MKFGICALATATLLFTTAAMAAPVKYVIDGSHTHVGFQVSHLGFSETYGVFKNVSGFLMLDKDKPDASSVEVTIDVNSVDTADEKRDEHVKGDKFFDAAKYPTITYKSTKVELTKDENEAYVTGDLTMHGVTKPVSLVVKLNKSAAHPMKKVPAAGFSAIGTLKRSDFGVNGYLPMIGDEVTLAISTEALAE